MPDHRAAAWLSALEMQYPFLIYLADPADSPWTRLCLRQADRILLVGAAMDDPAPGPLETMIDTVDPPVLAQRDLVLLHAAGTWLPSGTRRWLDPRPKVARHFHARYDHVGDFGRLARILAQHPVGVVFGGGGARGFAHIGVYRALTEAGLKADLIGGTSIGAAFGALFAMGMDWSEVRELCRMLERQKPDYTLPMIAMTGGFGLASAMRNLFSDTQIEDFWLPYFCVSANLTRAELAVHRGGPVAKWVRASCSLPGALPPVFDGDEIHVDGCILDNLPVDIMRADCRGPIIAVDIDQSYDMSTDMADGEGLSGWRLLFGRLNPLSPKRRVPTLARVIHRSAMVTSAQSSMHARDEADLYLHPPVENCGVFDWKQGERLMTQAFEYARPRIAEWRKSSDRRHGSDDA